MASRLARMPGGVLIPSRLTWEFLDESRSSYSEAGARPGSPEVVTDGTLYRVQASGGQGEDLDVVAVRSGYPGTMAVAYRLPDQGETADDDYRGWNVPTYWDAWAALQITASGATPWRRHDVVTLPDTQQAVALIRNGTTAAVRALPISTATLEGGSFGASVSSTGSWEHLAACVIPDRWATGGGRICLLYSGRIYTSTDAGATWTLHSKHPFRDDTTNYGQVRMEYRQGQILLLIEDTATANTVHQYLSTDGGSTFTLVASVASVGDTFAVAATVRGFHIVYRRATTYKVFSRRITNGGISLDSADEVTIHDHTSVTVDVADEGVALAAEPDGLLWAYHVTSTGDYIRASLSADGGDTWTEAQGGMFDSGGLQLRYFSATFAAGRCMFVHSWQNGDASVAAGVGLLALGGYSNWTTGPAPGGPGWEYTDRMGSAGYTDTPGVAQVAGLTWLPGILPENDGWTRTGTAPTLSTDGWLQFDTTAAFGWHTRNIGTGALTFEAELVVDAGGSSGALDVALSASVADGTDDYLCQLCLTTTELQVKDGNAASVVTTEAIDLTEPIVLQFELTEDGSVTIGWKRRGETRFELIVDAHSLTSDTATPGAAGFLLWGHLSTTTSTSRWRWLALQYHAATWQPRLYHGSDELYGRTMTGTATPIPDAGDTDGNVPWLRGSAGPARQGEQLLLPAHYERGVQHAFPSISPSPSSPWRTTDTSEQILAFDLGQTSWVGNALGLYIGHANFKTAVIEASAAGSSWTTVATLDLSGGLSGIGYTRGGDAVIFAAGTDADRYLWEGELDGGSWADSGGTVRRIAWNSAGSLASPASGVLTSPEIRLEGVTGSEPASGTMDLWAPSGLLVVYLPTALRRRFWRIRIPSQTTAEGYFEAGVIAAGRIQPWGAEVDLTRSDTWATNVSETRNSYGVSRLRERGPLARTWRFGWNDGANRGLIRKQLDLDYHGVSGGLALGAGEDVADLLAGIMREIRSGQLPVVVAEPLPDAGGTLTDPTRILYGRLRGAPSANGMAGDPNSIHEFIRIEAMSLEEIP